jgi:hypothetical protein
VAQLRTRATPGQGTGCSNASIGRCGAARYIEFSDGFIAFEEYFDASGAMIAAYTRSDIDPAGGWYGPVQSCERISDVVLCRDGKSAGD